MNFKEFQEYYKRYKRCPNDSFVRKNPYTARQLETRYKRYIRKESKKEVTSSIRELAIKRDNNECQLYKLANAEERKLIDSQLFLEVKHLDMAHVFNKSSYPELKYDLENVTMIYRLFHNRLDTQCNPITGKQIDSNELRRWWQIIIGEDRWNNLINKIEDNQ